MRLLFPQTDTWANRIGQLRVTLYSSDLEAKPEFEGRFFAKIFKDELLVNSLSQGAEEEYSGINNKWLRLYQQQWLRKYNLRQSETPY